MRVLLTGFMGTGKTAVGKRLAERLGLPFIDLDEIIEEASGASIREIFERQGEDEFRRRERAALKKALDMPEGIVATGGGTLVDASNRQLVRGHALTVWLNTPLQVIESRLHRGDRDSRPLFGDLSRVRELFRRRLPAYRQADLTIDIGVEDSVDQIADRLIPMLREAQCVTW